MCHIFPAFINMTGFFGSWGLVLFATMAVGVTWSTVQQHSGPIMGLFASAVVVLVAISSHGVKKNDGDFGQLVYGLVLSILTILLVGAMIKSSPDQLLPQSQQYILMVVFSIMWIVAASLLTFSGPFLNTGNGKIVHVFAVLSRRLYSMDSKMLQYCIMPFRRNTCK